MRLFGVIFQILHNLKILRRGRCLHRPLGTNGFAGDSRKIGSICRVDVGIDPYEFFEGKCNLILAIDGLDEANDAAICAVDGVIRGVFGEQPDLSLFAAEALDGCGVIEKRDHDLSVFGC